MSHRPLTEHAIKVVQQSDLSNMSRQALEGIVKLEKSAQGILKAHIEEIVRFLLEQLKWYDDGLDMGDASMLEFFLTQNDPKNVSDAHIATKTSDNKGQSEEHVTASQLEGMFSSQNDPEKTPSASTVTNDLLREAI